MRFKLIMAVLVPAVVGGCVHDTAESIRSVPRESSTFVVKGERYRVASTIRACLDRRYGVGYPASHIFAVLDESQPAAPGAPRDAVVTLWQEGIFGSRVLVLAEVRSIESGSEVTVYSSRGVDIFGRIPSDVERWMTGGAGC